MSLETLLEAAEFLEWNKSSGKKSSRATRTSKKAENYKPQLLTDRKRKVSGTKPVKVLTSAATSAASATTLSDFSLGGSSTFSDLAPTDQQQNITLKEIRKSLGNRETHNKLEKNRRAHLRECFDQLRKELPFVDERRASNLSTLKSAIRVIENLASRHKELEADKKRLQRLKSTRQAHINTLRKELRDKGVEYNIEDWIEGTKSSTNSTSTASECGDGVTDTLAVAAANSGVQNLIEAAAAEQPRSIQPAPLPSEMQLVIKPAPNAKSESATNVTMQATPLQTVHLVQQGGLTAQPQTLMMAPTQLAGTLVNKIVIPSASGDVLSSTASTQHQQLAPTNTQVPQVYTVTKLPGSAGPTNLSSKILLAPKSLSQLATTTTTISKSPEMTANQTIAQLIHPQLCTLSDGQMILAPANSEPPSVPQAVTPNTANFFIASAPGNESQQLQAMSGHPNL
ncbi:MNT [Bugula neritina]|uniref:MNT n=1 Tax=Bugula neritina TaxID=10212 RepID=A0A7J7IYT9_BUGNE|nr:MNT [Bugula neritina]